MLDMECIHGDQLPTHVLALSRQQTSETEAESLPLMIPIHAETWMDKTTIPLPPPIPGSTLPAPRWDASRQRPCQVITLPVVPIEVPHPEMMPTLLLFALGLEPLPNMLAQILLPPLVVAEFPHADEMSNVMATQLSADAISGYYEQNRRLWNNTLKLGVKSQHILDMVGKAYKVTVRAQDKLNSRRGPSR